MKLVAMVSLVFGAAMAAAGNAHAVNGACGVPSLMYACEIDSAFFGRFQFPSHDFGSTIAEASHPQSEHV